MTRIKLPWETDPIGFLIDRKFPRFSFVSNEEFRSESPDLQKEFEHLSVLVGAYELWLHEAGSDTIFALINEEKQKAISEVMQWMAELDKDQFFSDSYAVADFDHWSKASYWTRDEFVALSFGKEPGIVNPESLAEFHGQSLFVVEFQKRQDLVQRAIDAGQIFDQTIPGYLLAWALRVNLSVVPELIEAVVDLGIQVADWKTEFDKVVSYLNETVSNASLETAQLQADRDAALEAMEKVFDELGAVQTAHVELQAKLANGDQSAARQEESSAAERSA